MRYVVKIHQSTVGTVVVDADSPEAAVRETERRNELSGGWNDVIDGDFELLDDHLEAVPCADDDWPLTRWFEPAEPDPVSVRMARDGLTETEAIAALREEVAR